MNFKKLFDDDRAVSPVIGVILMVAITVILAAVIGTFVLGLGNQVQQTTPSVSIGFDYSPSDTSPGDTLQITHETGAELTGSNVDVVVSGATGTTDADDSYNWEANFPNGGSSVSAGSTVTVDSSTIGSSGDLSLSDATVRVTWTSETGDNSATLATWSGPDA